MGVINMAHGELMMIGAYATFVVQNLFRQHLPGVFDYYLLLAVPASFLPQLWGRGGAHGFRFLYGRPLETLLATWGWSLVLMQVGANRVWRAERAGGKPAMDVRWLLMY